MTKQTYTAEGITLTHSVGKRTVTRAYIKVNVVTPAGTFHVGDFRTPDEIAARIGTDNYRNLVIKK